MKLFHKKKGFLLYEALIAIIVFSIASVLCIIFQYKIVTIEKNAFYRLQAITIAHTVIETIFLTKKIPSIYTLYNTFTVESSSEPFVEPVAQNNSYHFSLITIKVSWNSFDGNTQSVKLTSGMII